MISVTRAAGDVALNLSWTADRRLEPTEDATIVQEKRFTNLRKAQPRTLWTLLYATDPDHRAEWRLKQVGPSAVLLDGRNGQGDAELVLAFTEGMDLAGVKIAADMGLVSKDRLTLAGCRDLW